MQPYQQSRRPRRGVNAPALGEPPSHLLAACRARPQQQADPRRRRSRRHRPGHAEWVQAAHSRSARSAAAVSAAPIVGTASCQPSRATAIVGRQTTTPRPNGFGTTMRSHVRSTQRRVVWAAQGSTRRARQRGKLGHPRRGNPARAAGAVRSYGDMIAAVEQAEQQPRTLRAAARRRPKHHVERETADHRADEATVAVLADQHVDAVARLASFGGLPRLQPKHRHQWQPLVPERDDHRCAGRVRRHMLVALERPPRGP